MHRESKGINNMKDREAGPGVVAAPSTNARNSSLTDAAIHVELANDYDGIIIEPANN